MSNNSTMNRIPIIPKPPHDPTWLLLNRRVGWNVERMSNLDHSCNLSLSTVPGTGRLITEGSGSFGGLTLPSNVAIGLDRYIYLLDKPTSVLKIFNTCECRFKAIACIGGIGNEAREFNEPNGIAICGNNLYVCDTGNHRLSIFAIHGWGLRTTWSPPLSAELTNQWDPFGIAIDRHGRVFVTDPANGCIHRFSSSGYWETCYFGFGVVTHLAIDCFDRLYAHVESESSEVVIVDTNGVRLNAVMRPGEVASYFPELPFEVDAYGNLYLGRICVADCSDDHNEVVTLKTKKIFDLHGNPFTKISESIQIAYEKKGYYLSSALDSRLYRCQWHRIVLQGVIPSGTTLAVLTYTAETDQTKGQLLSLPEESWETKQVVNKIEECEWDCLVRSNGGRYLWIKLIFRGNGLSTPVIGNIKIEFPRISLRRYLPAVFGSDPIGADFIDRFLSIFDTTLRSIEKKIDYQAEYLDPMSTPAETDEKDGKDFLTWLASWLGITLERHWSENKRRKFLKKAARLYHIRGTKDGLWQQLLFFLGLESGNSCNQDVTPEHLFKDCGSTETLNQPSNWQPPPLILEHYQLRRWLFLGGSRLGDQAVLWGKRIVNRSQLDEGAKVGRTQLITTHDPFRDPFHVYAHKFSVFVPACYGKSDRNRRGLENLLNREKPAHTQHQIVYVEPCFRIGIQSMVGLDSVIGQYPEGVILNEAPLGKDTILGKSPDKPGGPTMEVGKEARIGSTTRLN